MSDIHVMPTIDIREHIESLSCWCRPNIINEADVIFKNAKIIISHNRFLDADKEQEEYLK